MYAIWSRFSYLMNSSCIFPSLPLFRFIEQFKERVDALHQLAPNLGAGSLDVVHGDSSRASIVKIDVGVLNGGDLAVENPHPIDQRAALRGAFHQMKPSRHPRLPQCEPPPLYSTPGGRIAH